MNVINKEKLLYTITNSELQKKNDKVIQNFLSHFKHYDMKEELKNIDEEIRSERVLKPDLVRYNRVFDKNKCFYEPNLKLKKNYYPRQAFKLSLSNDNTEDNNSIKFESKNSSDSLESRKSEENSDDKNGSNDYDNTCEEEEEEEEEDIDNITIRTNPANNNYYINECNYDNNPQEILLKKHVMTSLINSDEKSFLTVIKYIDQVKVEGGNQSFGEKDFALFTLFKDYMEYPGWKVKIMNCGFLNNKFTTFELFEFLTDLITKNFRLDNFYIFNDSRNDTFEGGIFYFYLKSFLTIYFNLQNKQVEQNNYFLKFNQSNVFNNNFKGDNNYCNEDMKENQQLNYIRNGYCNNDNDDYQSFGFNA